ncbi:PH and SEC7 domain-containing protein 3 [Stylophora pistillata]|uniref:PH and SEC7 domain-containing protein 3 n=1 Tax=Stylophora pistillata TaxID=50429 RepID=A0A2B4RML8_STYPI|nr:PH and SEC7 domain-containing protein 3 [Stylophora pistillata]
MSDSRIPKQLLYSELSHGARKIQASESDKVYKEGLLYRKVTMSSEGKKDEVTAPEHTRNCLGVHHSLASRATDYIKRPFVFRFVTSDWREFLFQAKNFRDMNEWIEAINLVAATFSAPPLPAPVGSCKRFQRPALPFSCTQLPLMKQLEHHETKSKEAEGQLIESLQSKPQSGTGREFEEWQEKHEFLDYEYKRYKMYVNILRGSKLESKLREKPRGSGSSVNMSGNNSIEDDDLQFLDKEI